jgi:uncharacterized protein
VIAIDTNILVYAHRADSAFHVRAAARVREAAEGNASWAIPWPCVHEFFAIVTHPRIYAPPSPIGKALDQLDAWMESPALTLLAENDVYWPALRRTLETALVQGARAHDARIAALCVAHGVSELWSADRDFSRFGEVRIINPLVS